MLVLKVPWTVELEHECGVYEGTGGLSIDEWVEAYVESGTALREWVALWAVAQQTLVEWADGYERLMPDDPRP